MRLASVIPGAAIVPVVYLLARSLFSFRVAILTAVMTNFFLWFLILSRIAFQGITSVLMAMGRNVADSPWQRVTSGCGFPLPAAWRLGWGCTHSSSSSSISLDFGERRYSY